MSIMFEELSYFVEESKTTLLVCLIASTVNGAFHVNVYPVEGTASGMHKFTSVLQK